MQKIIHFCLSVGFVLFLQDLHSQTTVPGQPIYIYYQPGAANTSLPSQVGVTERSSDFVINFIGNWPPDAMAAFDYAVSIWEHHLTSTVPITVDASFTALAQGVLGGARPTEITRDFPNAPKAGTWYPMALANKLEEDDLSPNKSDITCDFTTNAALMPLGISWNFDHTAMPTASQVDFATVILHELAHGLLGGTFSTVGPTGVGSIGGNGLQGLPSVFDSFVIDCSDGTQMTDLQNNTVALGNFLTNGNLCWGDENGNTSCQAGGNPPQLFAPNPFQPGSSISHLDNNTYPAGNPNSLMTPSVSTAEQILQVGDLFLCMMEEAGWMVDYTTGIEDDLVIVDCPSVMNQGQAFTITSTFYDEEPYGDYIANNSHEWSMEPLNTNGFYPLLVTQYPTSDWNHWVNQVPYLPASSNYTWERNADGTVRTKVKVSADDNHSFYHEDHRDIGIKLIPDQPYLQSTYLGCYKVKLTFFSRGATSYEVYYDTNAGAPYNGTGLPQGNSPITVNGGTNTITLTNLTPNQMYYFNVRGKNSAGYSTYAFETFHMIPIEEKKCGGIIFVTGCPTPSLTTLDVTEVSWDGGSEVFVDIVDGVKTATYKGSLNAGTINLAQIGQVLANTDYSATVQLESGKTYTARLRYQNEGTYYSAETNFTAVPNTLLCGRSSDEDGALSGSNINQESFLTISPNPANQSAIINVQVAQNVKGNVEVCVLGSSGKMVKKFEVDSSESKLLLNTTEMAPGVYFVQLKLNGEPKIGQRLVVVR